MAPSFTRLSYKSALSGLLITLCTLPLISSSGLAQGVLFPPTNVRFTNVTTTSAQVSWDFNPVNAQMFSVYYKLQTSAAYTWAGTTPSSDGINPPISTFALNSLAVGSIYNVYVVTEGNDGDSRTSTVASFSTLGPPPPTCTNDAFEPNNTFATRKPLAVGTNLKGKICDLTDIDLFSFTITRQRPNIKALLATLPTNYNVEVYNPFGGLQATGANAGIADELVTINNAVQGEWLVAVRAGQGAVQSATPYKLRVDVSRTPYTREGLEERMKLSVYPNPATNSVYLNLGDDTLVEVTLFDMQGRVVINQKVSTGKQHISVEALPAGLYHLVAKSDLEAVYSQALSVVR